MAFQYQYQYQLQRGIGITPYESFSHLIKDVYSNPILVSLLVAIVPLLLLIFWKMFAQSRVRLTLQAMYHRRREKKQLKLARVMFEEHFMKKEKKEIFTFLMLGLTLLLGGMIFTKSLFFVAVTSNSMAPTFWESDLVLVQSFSNEYQKGDIAVFNDPKARDIMVIHRIASTAAETVKTQGDNNANVDDWIINKKNILGTAILFNGRPVVAKKVGRYFIRNFDLTLESDPLFQNIQRSISSVRAYGPLYLIFIILLIFISQLRESERSKFY